MVERKRVEGMLRESEEEFRSIVETSTEWIWTIDRRARLTYSNPAIERILGYRPEEVIGKDALLFMHEEDRIEIEEVLPKLVSEKKGWSELVLRWRHENGTYRYLESNAVPILNHRGELLGYRGADRDITERKEVEAKLRSSEAELRALFEAMDDVILVLDSEGRYLSRRDAILASRQRSPRFCINRPSSWLERRFMRYSRLTKPICSSIMFNAF